MLHDLNAELVNAMRKKLPDKTTLANVLVNLLGIGREAAYRRIRGLVPFSVEEIGIIAQKLDISLDKLLNLKEEDEKALTPINFLRYVSPTELYENRVSEYANLFNQFAGETQSKLMVASNVLLQTFYFKYKYLSRFSFYRWMYRQGESNLGKSFETVDIPDKIWEEQKRYAIATQSFKECYHILGKEIFSLFVNDVRYVYNLHLMSYRSLQEIKKELLQVIDDLEKISAEGCFENRHKVEIKFSKWNFTATYALIQTGNHKLTMVKIFSIDTIVSYTNKAFTNLKIWLDETWQRSIILTKETDKQKEYFNHQRQIVQSLSDRGEAYL